MPQHINARMFLDEITLLLRNYDSNWEILTIGVTCGYDHLAPNGEKWHNPYNIILKHRKTGESVQHYLPFWQP